MSQYCLIYSLFPDFESASEVARDLIENKLAACTNCMPAINSYFAWQGEIQDVCEVIVLAKTSNELAEQVFERIRELHTYEVPCILSIPIDKIDPAFADWVNDNLEVCPQ